MIKFSAKGGYGIVSCYNSLPLAGGGSTLVRLNLKAIAERSESANHFYAHSTALLPAANSHHRCAV